MSNRLALSRMAPRESVFAPRREGDADLVAIQEVRDLLAKAREARATLEDYDQETTDRIVAAMVKAGSDHAFDLAKLAVEESGFGVVAGKTLKNLFATDFTWQHIKDMRTVGVIGRDDKRRVYEIAHPAGVVAAIIPITNPTSTALFKCIVALKARCPIVVSPHPRGVKCIYESCRIVAEAARQAGAPEGAISCMTKPTLESTNELMGHRWTSVVLATGGAGLVEAAYSSGKPAFGVGPGNSPAFVDRSANVRKAARAIVLGQVFDNGTICSSEQSIVADRPIAEALLSELKRRGAHLCSDAEVGKLGPVVLAGNRQNPDIVGQYPRVIAEMAGFSVPHDTTVLLCPTQGVGFDHPLSIEKLSPVLALYVVDGWQQGIEQCRELLRFGGMGHSMSIHAEDERVVWEVASACTASRIMVNSPTTQGAIGYTTNLFPSMQLGCGTPGGNVVSDNIGPQHLLNRKRLAWVREEMLDENERRDIEWRRKAGDTPLPWSADAPASSRPPAHIGAGGWGSVWGSGFEPKEASAARQPVAAAAAAPVAQTAASQAATSYKVASGGAEPGQARPRGPFGSVLPLTPKDIETIISRSGRPKA